VAAAKTVYRIEITGNAAGNAKKAALSVRRLGQAVRKANTAFKAHDRVAGRLATKYAKIDRSAASAARSMRKFGSIGTANRKALREMNPGRPERFAKALNKVARAYSTIAAKAGRAAQAMRRSNRQMARGARDARALGRAQRRARGGGALGRVRGAIGAATGPVGAIAAAGAAGGLAVGGGILALGKTQAEVERLEFAFNQLGIGASKGMGAAGRIAERTQQRLTVVGQTLLNLTRRGFDFATSQELALRTADLRAVGATDEELESVVRQLGQIKSIGKLMGEELNIIAESGVNADAIWRKLGEITGKTREELVKMQQAGKITADVALPAITEAMKEVTGGREAGAAAEEYARQTTRGAASGVMAAIENGMIRINKVIGKKPFANVLGEVTRAFDRMNTTDVGNIASFIKQILENLRGMVFLGGEFFKGVASMLGPLEKENQTLWDMRHTLQPLAKAFGKMAGWIAQMTLESIESEAKSWKMTIEGLNAAVGKLYDLIQKITGAGEAAGNALDWLNNPLGMAAKSLLGAFGDEDDGEKSGGKMGSGVKKGFREELGIRSPSKVFEEMGEQSTQGFDRGITGEGQGRGPSYSAADLAPGAGSGMAAAAGGGGGGGASLGGVTVNQEIRIDGSGDPAETAQMVKRMSVAELGIALEQLARQAGAA